MAPAPARPPAPAELPLGGSRELPSLLRRVNRPAALTALVLLAALWSFAHVVEDYLTGDPLVRWDVELARWLHGHSPGLVVHLASALTWAGEIPVLAAATVVGLIVLLRRRRLADAVFLAVTALGIEVLVGALKLAFHRPRPQLAFVHLDTYSFPSGHASGSAAIYPALAYLLVRAAPPRRRWAVAAATAALVLAVDATRLVLGAHYLSDVLAGDALGLAWFSACLLALQLRPARRA